MTSQSTPNNIDEYISVFSPEVQSVLEKIRNIIHEVAPDSVEKISYRMPAFFLNGKILIYFAAFKNHIGVYPPVKADSRLMTTLAPFMGPKGNLKFPFNLEISYELIRKVVEYRIKHQG